MQDTFAHTRCTSCGKGLKFEEWSRGGQSCAACLRSSGGNGPAATFVPGPARPSRGSTARVRSEGDYPSYERMLDEIPEELVDELVAALEAEAERRQQPRSAPEAAVREVLDEIGFGRSPFEYQWAAWGFAAGFALNVALAKYAQMSTGSSMSEFIGPLLIGGVAAGAACGAIGWGLAKLRHP